MQLCATGDAHGSARRRHRQHLELDRAAAERHARARAQQPAGERGVQLQPQPLLLAQVLVTAALQLVDSLARVAQLLHDELRRLGAAALRATGRQLEQPRLERRALRLGDGLATLPDKLPVVPATTSRILACPASHSSTGMIASGWSFSILHRVVARRASRGTTRPLT